MIRNGKKSNTLFMTVEDWYEKYPQMREKYEVVGEWDGVENRVEIKCKECQRSWNAIPYVLCVNKARCPYCKGSKTKYDTLYFKNLCDMHKFDLLSPCESATDEVIVKHRECNNILVRKANVLKKHFACPHCHVNSRGEKEIQETLNDYKIEYKKELTFSDLKGLKGGSLRFDFGIYKDGELIFIIEYDGKQHEEEIDDKLFKFNFDLIKAHDEIKDEYCKDNNIDLYRISYHKRRTISKIVTQLLSDYMLIPSQANES